MDLIQTESCMQSLKHGLRSCSDPIALAFSVAISVTVTLSMNGSQISDVMAPQVGFRKGYLEIIGERLDCTNVIHHRLFIEGA
jgi:hypothetical protein